MSNGFKIFGSQDWLKVCDISILEYTKDKLDKNGHVIPAFDANNQPILKKTFTGKVEVDQNGTPIQDTVKESKGWRVKLEFTDDGWKTKKIIYLQDAEVADFIAILLGKKLSNKFQRENKSVVVEYQGEHSFMKFSQKDWEVSKFYATKIDKFSGLKIIALCLTVLQLEFKREMGVGIDQKALLESIISLNTTNSNVSTPVVSSPVISTVTTQPVNQTTSQSANWKIVCKCGHELDPVKEFKVIDFSTKKFGTPTCFNCQQKLKWQ